MNLTGRPVYLKGAKLKRAKHPSGESVSGIPLATLLAKGTERQYLDWLRLQRSAIDGSSDWDSQTGMGYCVPAHFRTAKNAGTGTKPDFDAIPLTDAQHKLQHAIGTFQFLPRERWIEFVRYYQQLWLLS